MTSPEFFASEVELARLAASWPSSRLIDIWNGLTGVTPIKKFTDRKKAAARIWKQIEPMRAEAGAIVQSAALKARRKGESKAKAPHNVNVAPGKGSGKDKATRARRAPSPPVDAESTRKNTKAATVLELLKHKGGSSLKAIMEATGWQAHSVRGFLSGTIKKKMGLEVISAKAENGERSYSIKA
jgi:hypothetical protein